MTTLLLSNWALAPARSLASAARKRGWRAVAAGDVRNNDRLSDELALYSSTLEGVQIAARFDLALLEPPLDLLAVMPMDLLLRTVKFGHWRDRRELARPMFLKPADPLNKAFDAGVYRDLAQIRIPRPLPPKTPVLLSDPVEWLCEYRCFVLERKVVAFSPYLSFGRPLHHAGGSSTGAVLPAAVMDVCKRLFSAVPDLPPAFVVDVGLIEDRGWALVEFNPAWCSGLLSANSDAVLDVLLRSCRKRSHLAPADRKWVVKR